jgi:NlpC/P60 family putative phage cell wall peptidase
MEYAPVNATEPQQRQRVVEVAKSFISTPYHHMGMIKGVGVDCLTLLAAVFNEAGLIEQPEIPYYPSDWMLHRDAERYLEGVMKYCREVPTPQPGDIALWKFGRCFSHGAIVIEWPMIIHAYWRRNCILEDALAATWLTRIGENGPDQGKERQVRFFSFWR